MSIIPIGNNIAGASPVIRSQTVGLPALGSTNAVKTAVASTGSPQTITAGITNPDVARNVTATSGGTAGDIKAVQVTVIGTDINGVTITETLPAFTQDSATTVVGNKAFKTVTSITMPAHDGTGATTAIGTGAKLGLDRKVSRNSTLYAFLNGVRESTPPTVTFDADNVSGNTVTLASALNGNAVIIDGY